MQLLELVVDEFHEHLLIDEDTDHHREVVEGQIALHDHGEDPKGVLLAQVLPQAPHNEVHPLTVPDRWVPLNVRLQHPFQGILRLLLLIERVCRERSLEVEIDLSEVGIRIFCDSLAKPPIIIVLIVLPVAEGPGADQPKLQNSHNHREVCLPVP